MRPDRIVLLGTKGGPALRSAARCPSASLLVLGGEPYVIDAGHGVSVRLVEAGVPLSAVRTLLVTHHHSDHNLEAGPLIYNAWACGRSAPMRVFGPSGLRTLFDAFFAAHAFDIETRIADEGRPDPRRLLEIAEHGAGVVLREAGVTVSALRNIHPPLVESFALKFEGHGQTIVFSGDTAYFPPLAEFAKGADVLVHEVMYGPALPRLVERTPNAARLMEHLKASHTLAEDVGRIAAAAGARRLVLNHFVPGDDPSLGDAVWRQAVATTFAGEIIVGRDLLEVPL